MRLALLSDSHDNLWALKAALPQLATADLAIHCGDLCSPFMVRHLGDGMQGKPVHIVWGNNEGDVLLMTKAAAQLGNITLHGAFAQFTVGGLRVAVNHYPDIARPLAASGHFDLVCYGHDHIAAHSLVGACHLLNPGELMGLNGRRTIAFFDTETRAVEFVDVPL